MVFFCINGFCIFRFSLSLRTIMLLLYTNVYLGSDSNVPKFPGHSMIINNYDVLLPTFFVLQYFIAGILIFAL